MPIRRIVERGSFSRAAEDLGVSAALLSREIKLLEESLGSALLDPDHALNVPDRCGAALL
jgi:DNA-binding transcriptional LysR family regulator